MPGKQFFADDSKVEGDITNALNETTEETSTEDAPSKIKVGDKEYDSAELESLVGLGQLGREMEEKWNTKIDKVYPAFTKSQNTNKELEEKLAEIDSKAQGVTEAGGTEGDALKEAQDAARKLGLTLNDDLDAKIAKVIEQKTATKTLMDQTASYEKEIDGKDGRPAFKSQDVMQYMVDEGIKNPMTAYKLKYEEKLDAWKETELGKTKKKGLATDDSTGSLNKAPKDVKVTRDNLNAQVAEALRG